MRANPQTSQPFRPLVPVALSVALGVYLADALSVRPGLAWTGTLLLFLPVLVAARLRGSLRVLWCLPWICLGADRHAHVLHPDPRLDAARLASPADSLICLRGVVTRSPVGRTEGTYVIAASEAGLPWRRVVGEVSFFLRGANHRGPRYGDRVALTGQVRRLAAARNPGQWDAARAGGRRGLRARLHGIEPLAIQVLQSPSPWHPVRALEDLRGRLARLADRHLPSKRAGLFRALLLGDRVALDAHLQDDFRRGGILHFLAISGLHVALVGGGLHRLLRSLGVSRAPAAILVVAVLFLYTGLAGFRTPVVRAAVLAGGAFIAPTLLRAADPWNLIAGAAAVSLLVAPGDLFRPGFALSYGAVSGILLMANRLDPSPRIIDYPGDALATRIAKRLSRASVSGVAVTLAAWLGSGPLIWEVFGTVHPWSLLSNLVVLPVFVVTLIASLLAAICLPLGSVAAAVPCNVFCGSAWCLDQVGALSAGLPGACTRVASAGAPAVVACTLLLVAARKWNLCVVLIPLLLVAASWREGARGSEVTVLDVGQGLSVFVSAQGSDAWLYDAGSTDLPSVTGRVIAPFLRARGRRRCSHLFVSHVDHDHTSGVADLQDGGWVDRILGPEPPPGGSGGFQRVVAGDGEVGPNWWWRVLHPPAGATRFLDRNDRSLVLQAEVDGLRLLLAGDVEAAGLFLATRAVAAPIDVLVLPHHGSYSWNLRAFLERVAPCLVLVSARRGFADRRTLAILEDLGIPTFFTWRHGALQVTWSAHHVTCEGHLGARARIRRRSGADP